MNSVGRKFGGGGGGGALWPIISLKSGGTIQDHDASHYNCFYMSSGQEGRSDMGDPPPILSVH